MNIISAIKNIRLFFELIFLIFLFQIFILPFNVYATYLGLGLQYSYSFLKYKIIEDDFYGFDEYEFAEEYNSLSQVGIENNVKTRSKDYGFCIIIDDGEEFEQLGHLQLRLEYSYFYIPFENVNNTVKGIRSGFSVSFGIDVLNLGSNIIYTAFTTGSYLSRGKSSINKSEYIILEMPLGIIIGDKFAVSQNSAVVVSGTYNFYNHFINNHTYLLGGANSANGSMLNFTPRRNEFIINCSYVYQFGDIYY